MERCQVVMKWCSVTISPMPSSRSGASSVRRRVATFGATMKAIMVNELRAVVEELGGEPVLGHPLRTQNDLHDAIRDGFPQKVVEDSLKELAQILDLSPRSLQR
jgi:hypothetical protein